MLWRCRSKMYSQPGTAGTVQSAELTELTVMGSNGACAVPASACIFYMWPCPTHTVCRQDQCIPWPFVRLRLLGLVNTLLFSLIVAFTGFRVRVWDSWLWILLFCQTYELQRLSVSLYFMCEMSQYRSDHSAADVLWWWFDNHNDN